MKRNDSVMRTTMNGSEIWILNNKYYHRTDGPALTYPNGRTVWYLMGKRYSSFEDYVVKAGWSDEQIVMYKLERF